MRFVLALLLAVWGGAVLGQDIDVPSTAPEYTIVVAKLNQDLPDGVYLSDGGWEVSSTDDASTRETDNGLILLFTGKPGLYVLEFDAVKLKDIVVPDMDGNPQTLPIYLGRIKAKASCTIEGEEPGPNPPGPDPPGPEPSGPYQLMFFYDGDTLDNLPESQRLLLTSRVIRDRLKSEGHVLLEVLEVDSLSGSVPAMYQPWLNAIKGDPMPRIALAPRETRGVVKDYPLPANWEDLQKLLSEAK